MNQTCKELCDFKTGICFIHRSSWFRQTQTMRNSNILSHRLQSCFLNTKEQSIKTPLKNAQREGYLKNFNLKATVSKSELGRGPLLFHQAHCKAVALLFLWHICSVSSGNVFIDYTRVLFTKILKWPICFLCQQKIIFKSKFVSWNIALFHFSGQIGKSEPEVWRI